jgi:acylphosphatase
MQRLEAVCYGYVQGVGFRWFVRRRAQALGLRGWTRNEPDGTVRVVAEGEPKTLETLLRDLQEGPPGSRVQRVEESWTIATHEFSGFEVRY